MLNSSDSKQPLALSLKNITLAYRRQTVLTDLSGDIQTGSLTAIVGANGCGKSTLIKAIAGMIKPIAGKIENYIAKTHTAYLSQISEIDRSFPITVFDFVACGLWAQTGAFKAINKEKTTLITEALDAVGMRAYKSRLIGELSGGQFQRIRFAQLTLQHAQLLLLDEPFTGVDEHTITDLMCLMNYWHEQGATLLVVLHDMELVRQQFPHVIVLGENRALGWGNTSTHLNAYAQALNQHKGTNCPAIVHPLHAEKSP